MTEQATTANKRSNIVLRRTLPTLLAAFAVWALVSSFLALDITEYGLVTRFGRVVRVLAEPGLHVVAPFDRVVRLDKRILFFRPALSEYLTIDKKNLGVDSLVTWRIADPVRFLAAVATPPAGEQRLSDIILAEIGAVVGRYPASVLISTDPASSNYQTMAAEVVRRVAEFARTAYGIDVVSVDIRRLHLPELNREHVFERMKAERAKIAKENRSAGELEAKRITAEADHEKIHRLGGCRTGRAHQGRGRRRGVAHLRCSFRAGSGFLPVPANLAGLRQVPRRQDDSLPPDRCRRSADAALRHATGPGRTVPSGARSNFDRSAPE